jgi:hypothetical protein
MATPEDQSGDCVVADLPGLSGLSSSSKLPSPFTKLDGTSVSTKADWHCRREEIRQLAEKFVYGAKLPKPESVTGTVTTSTITVTVTDNGKTSSFSAPVVAPTSGSPPYPAIIVYGGATGAPLDSTVINSEGVALIGYDPFQAGQEGTPRSAKQGAFYDIAGSNSSTGLLIAWAWGVSRILDVIDASGMSVIQPAAVGVTGCSRFGKGAFVAGAFDDRIALTMPIESGTGGVPIWRGVNGEGAQTLSSAYGEQPWLGDAFLSFVADPLILPLDTHEVIGMVAPRGLFIMDNPYITNLGPISADVAVQAGAEIYTALGAGGNITYWSNIQDGTHCAQRPEWSAPLKANIEAFLKNTGSAPGVIQASPNATGNVSSWVTWQAPTLQ